MDLNRGALALAMLVTLLTVPAAAQETPEEGAAAPSGDTRDSEPVTPSASDLEEEPAAGSPFDAESYVALSADQDAQESLGGFRRYLERTRESDTDLYRVLDARLDDLESSETVADVIFWTATGLGAASLIAAIPVHETLGLDPAIGFLIGGGGVFLLGVLIQAIVRPGRGDLVELIDLHDSRLGRR
ncbi:MAG: hypothetical protein AB8I08_06370 [Sandaracinaceae bacterium]